MNWFFSLTDATGWAAIQAVGSIAAIFAGFAFVLLQNGLESCHAKRERADRATVVAYRVSGWLAEVGTRVKLKQDRYYLIRKHNPKLPHPGEIGRELKFNMVVGIDELMSDLHYLKKGAGDVAQLDYFIKSYDDLLDQDINYYDVLLSDQAISSLPLIIEEDVYTGVETTCGPSSSSLTRPTGCLSLSWTPQLKRNGEARSALGRSGLLIEAGGALPLFPSLPRGGHHDRRHGTLT